MIIEKVKRNYRNVSQSWGIIGIMLLMSLLFSPVTLLLPHIAGKEFSFLAYYVLSTGASFFVFHRRRKERTGFNSYDISLGTPKIIGLVAIAVIAIQAGLSTPISSLIPMPEFMKEIFIEFASQKGIFSFMSIVIAAPILEELIFRGIILDGLLRKYSPVKSILISSLLFGIIHLNPWQFVGAMIIGIFMGWVYYKTGKLILTIIIHFTNNLAAFLSMNDADPQTEFNKSLPEFYGGYMNLILITAGAILIAVVCIYQLKKEFQKIELKTWQHGTKVENQLPFIEITTTIPNL